MNTLNVNVSRLIRAAPDEVFRAWMDSERLQRWFGTSRQIVNPKVDGLFYLAMEHEGQTWPACRTPSSAAGTNRGGRRSSPSSRKPSNRNRRGPSLVHLTLAGGREVR